ncbi:PTC1, partial [Symbiodinium sp. CCMP2456]
EWLDYLYWIQTQGVLLTPAYAAYLSEVARLLGIPTTQRVDEENIHVRATGTAGSYIVKWYVDARKLKTNDKQIISPGFELYHPGNGQVLRFLIGAFPMGWSAANPGENFNKAAGRGYFQLKCDTGPKDQGCLPCRFGFSVANGEMRTASGRFTLNKSMLELPREDSVFDMFGGVGRDNLVEITALIDLARPQNLPAPVRRFRWFFEVSTNTLQFQEAPVDIGLSSDVFAVASSCTTAVYRVLRVLQDSSASEPTRMWMEILLPTILRFWKRSNRALRRCECGLDGEMAKRRSLRSCRCHVSPRPLRSTVVRAKADRSPRRVRATV